MARTKTTPRIRRGKKQIERRDMIKSVFRQAAMAGQRRKEYLAADSREQEATYRNREEERRTSDG